MSLPSDLVQLIDRCTRELKETRSGLIEEWLRRAARQQWQRELDDEITAYYTSRTPEEQAEDEAIAEASSRHAAMLVIDDAPRRSRKRR